MAKAKTKGRSQREETPAFDADEAMEDAAPAAESEAQDQAAAELETEQEPAAEPETEQQPPPAETEEPPADLVQTVEEAEHLDGERIGLHLPVHAWTGGHVIRHPQLKRLSRRNATALRCLFLSLQADGETLQNGDPIAHQGTALLWVLEQYAATIGDDRLEKMVEQTT